MNIEHAYFDRTGEYKPFPGICLVDTFDMRAQSTFFTEANTARIEAQRVLPIFVVIGNPPYNAWQVNENDSNKNRKYKEIDDRVAETYSKSSIATNKNALSDPYVKAIRWASDRIGQEGVVALVTNSGFVDGLATDGMRAHLAADFDQIYILDLGGNVRKNPKLSGTTHNVFGIQVGVSVNVFVRRGTPREKRACKILYATAERNWTRWQKYIWLEQIDHASGLSWTHIRPNSRNRWLSDGAVEDFDAMTAISDIFAAHSRGVATSRDAWVYNFDAALLKVNITKTVRFYNDEIARWKAHEDRDVSVDKFVRYDDSAISWSRDLKQDLQRKKRAEFSPAKIYKCLYRPFTTLNLFFDRVLNEEVYVFPSFAPSRQAESENTLICLTGPGSEKPFVSLAAHNIVDLHLSGPGCSTQCFPFYTYAEDGTNRRENITDWSLEQFRSHYGDPSITKWDTFHYVYAVLHSPEYRERYAANLRRELPRIPFVAGAEAPGLKSTDGEEPNAGLKPHSSTEVFRAFVNAGKQLAEIHVHYEQQPEYPLKKIEKPGEKLDYRITKMRLSKDKTQIVYNDFLTLSGVPTETFEYRLGNRSALDWIIDQYQVSTDKRSGITNDPNRSDDPTYILRLIGQVITVSLETVNLVRSLPPLGLPGSSTEPVPTAADAPA